MNRTRIGAPYYAGKFGIECMDGWHDPISRKKRKVWEGACCRRASLQHCILCQKSVFRIQFSGAVKSFSFSPPSVCCAKWRREKEAMSVKKQEVLRESRGRDRRK